MPFTSPKNRIKQEAKRKGNEGEFFALILLRLKGYRLIARNYTCPFGEIDLVVRRGKWIVFVEVKTRLSQEEAMHSLHENQKKRILKSAMWLLKERKELKKLNIRFDFVAMAPKRFPKHIQNAWGEFP